MKEKENIIKKPVHLILVCLFFIALAITVISGILRKSKTKTITYYYQSHEYILEGFCQAINYYLQNYEKEVFSLIDGKRFQTYSDEDIAAYLAEKRQFIDLDIYNLFYIKPDCSIIFSDSHTEDFSDTISFQDIKEKTGRYYVTDITTARNSDTRLFSIICPVRTKDGVTIGAAGTSVKIEAIRNVIQNIKLGDTGSISLTDFNGNFVIHMNENLLGKSYTPPSTKYEHLTSKFVSQQPDGHILTENYNGDLVDLFYRRIENTDWVLAIGTSHSNLKEIYNDYARSTAVLIVVFILLIAILIFQCILAINYFKSKKLLTVDIDPLTNLNTRARFEIEAEKLLKKYPKSKFMLMECDIRGFKFVNQNYGGQEADKLIVYFANILNDFTNSKGGLLGRGYADHFYLFFKVDSIHRGVAEFKEENAKLNELIKNYDISFFPKFGISFIVPQEGQTPKTIPELIGQASFAKSTIKDNMLVQYALYNSTLLEKVNQERFIENNMEQALENGEFFVLYQPKIELLTEKIVGAEALVRWNSPKLGILTPDSFIPLFERNGFIKKLDFYVYNRVFKFISRMLADNINMVPVSVNMSRNHSKPEKFMHEFLSLFREYNIPSELVEVEILERSFMDGGTLKMFAQLLHEEGFTVAMDDFGSGESSLNMLSQIPVDVLKFDRTFLDSSTTEDGSISKESANFIETLIELSKNLKKQTIFEGVETKAQIEFLRGIECDQVQGFYFSKPLTEFDFIEYLKEHS